MIEPVAYRVDGTIYNNINDAEFAVRETEHLRSSLGIDNGLIRKPVIIESLYTKDQLHPRVKMTQAEFDEFKRLFEYVDYASIALATIQHVKDEFNKLGERVYSGTVNERIKKKMSSMFYGLTITQTIQKKRLRLFLL